jgi:hypothetical protein
MLRTVVLVVLLTLGACAPTSRDLAERPVYSFDTLPAGMHDCPVDTRSAGYTRFPYVEHLCVRVDDHQRPERHGPFVRFDQHARRTLDGSYAHGLRHGTWRVYREDGSVFYTLEYERGRIGNLACPEGQLLSAHRNSSGAWCGPYFRAVRDGPSYHFYPETMRFRALGTYTEGRRDGTWVLWDRSGNVVKVEQWVLGSVAWRWEQLCPKTTDYPLPDRG